jgi:hypothetical protein
MYIGLFYWGKQKMLVTTQAERRLGVCRWESGEVVKGFGDPPRSSSCGDEVAGCLHARAEGAG